MVGEGFETDGRNRIPPPSRSTRASDLSYVTRIWIRSDLWGKQKREKGTEVSSSVPSCSSQSEALPALALPLSSCSFS